MKILFICTAYNSLSQRLALELSEHCGHEITLEYALSQQIMIEAMRIAKPDLILCPFLTKRIPSEVYTTCMTLIVHPGPPSDEGPSALDWCIIGDKGESSDADSQLTLIDASHAATNGKSDAAIRSHWGVTVLQAVEAFDSGPVWAFDQFELSPEIAKMTKSEMYRGPVTRCALNAVLAALHRIDSARSSTVISPNLPCNPVYRQMCVSQNKPFLGGKTHTRPLLKAAARDFVPFVASSTATSKLTRENPVSEVRVSADLIVQRIRSADSQPGVLSTIFGIDFPFFLYNASVERGTLPSHICARDNGAVGTLLATREGAVLVNVGADAPIWIALLRRPKTKSDKNLHPKLPAVMALLEIPVLALRLGLSTACSTPVPEWSIDVHCVPGNPWARQVDTYQQIWVELDSAPATHVDIAYIYTEFYNGAFSTLQCQLLLRAIRWVLTQPRVRAVVMMGGAGYFSNGIALNVIEGSQDAPAEGWANIKAIDDCVQALLAPAGVVTFAALRGSAAAGGLALATASDFVLCADTVVLNPHYRSLGLYGSEWHTYSWHQRCGKEIADEFLRSMLPMSAHHAHKIGLVDHILPTTDCTAVQLVDRIKEFVHLVMQAKAPHDGLTVVSKPQLFGASWTKPLSQNRITASNVSTATDQSDSAAQWSKILTNKHRYLANLCGNPTATRAQLHEYLAEYRKRELAQMQLDFFHPYRQMRFALRCTAFVRKLVPVATPTRFALHRRFPSTDGSAAAILDEEERDQFDNLGGIPTSEAVARLPSRRPEFLVDVQQLDSKNGQDSDSCASSQTASVEKEIESGSRPSTASTSPTAKSASPTLAHQNTKIERPSQSKSKPNEEKTIGGKVIRFFKSLRRPIQNPPTDDRDAPHVPMSAAPPRLPAEASDGLWSCYYANANATDINSSK